MKTGLTHALVNGGVMVGFTCLNFFEYSHYPTISEGPGFLAVEGVLLATMGIGNHFGGALVWRRLR